MGAKKWNWDSGFALRLGGGVMYYKAGASSTDSDGTESVEISLDGVRGVIDASLGWTF